jgi:hypothetical protein
MTYRLDSSAAEDVRWFWNQAPGELGLRASSMQPTTHCMGQGDDTRALNAARRWRRVWKALTALRDEQVRVLQRYYAAEVPWRGLEHFGDMAGVALLSDVARRRFRDTTGAKRVGEQAFGAWLRGLSARIRGERGGASDEDRRLASDIISDCDLALYRASHDYANACALVRLRQAEEAEGRERANVRQARVWRERKERERCKT